MIMDEMAIIIDRKWSHLHYCKVLKDIFLFLKSRNYRCSNIQNVQMNKHFTFESRRNLLLIIHFRFICSMFFWLSESKLCGRLANFFYSCTLHNFLRLNIAAPVRLNCLLSGCRVARGEGDPIRPTRGS